MNKTKDKCLRYTANVDPTRDRPCDACSLGPCAYIPQPPRPRRRRANHERPPRNESGRPFPRILEDLQFFGGSAIGAFVPSVRCTSYLIETNEVLSTSIREHPDGCVTQSGVLVEINRLPNSYGTQCIHERIFVPASDIIDHPAVYGPYTKSIDPNHDYLGEIYEYSGEYIRAKLVEALAPQNYNYEDLLPHGMSRDILVAEAYAFKAMRPEFKTGFSTLNFLLEMDDLTSLLPNIHKTFTSITKNLSKTLKVMEDLSSEFRSRRLPDLNRITLNQVVSLIAEAKLTKDFAIEPLIGDIGKVCTIIERFESNFERFRQGATSLGLKRHFRSFIEATTEYKDSLTRTVTISLDRANVTYECKVEGFDPQSNGTPQDHVCYTATMDYTYACHTLADMDPYVAALYTELGIKPDASIIWNAIPFSFVLDWFFNIQGFLDKYASVDLITSEVTIHQWLMGIRARPIWTCRPVDVTWHSGVEPGIQLMSTEVLHGQSYARLVRNPDIDKLVELNQKTPDGLTLNRGYLSAALIKKLVF